MKTFKEIQELNWENYGIEDMHNFKFKVGKADYKDFLIYGKNIKHKITLIPVNSLYELSKIEPRKEFLILSDSANSARGYNWNEGLTKNGFDNNGEPILEYLKFFFTRNIQDYMKFNKNIFMPCF